MEQKQFKLIYEIFVNTFTFLKKGFKLLIKLDTNYKKTHSEDTAWYLNNCYIFTN